MARRGTPNRGSAAGRQAALARATQFTGTVSAGNSGSGARLSGGTPNRGNVAPRSGGK